MQKCFVDLDGCLVDFIGAALRLHRIDPTAVNHAGLWDTWKTVGMNEESTFWHSIEAKGEAFWENLEWMPDGREILHMIERRFGVENICLLSTPSKHPASASGKLRWISRHIPRYSRQYLLGPCKAFCAGPGKLLVDDSDKNVKEFREAGGSVILVPRPWNSLHASADRAVDIVRMMLEDTP